MGLKLAGMDVIGSYERSAIANLTNEQNNGHLVQQVDLRAADPPMFPQNVAVVVGSPPCTQFSFSNRGGAGDLADGIVDIVTFLRIVDRLKPHMWAMENVPRLSKIISAELREGGKLAEFAHLGIQHAVFDLQDFGVPQKRKRCIVGNFDFALLQSYRPFINRRTLGTVVRALEKNPAVDPSYGYSIPRSALQDHILEQTLDEEEVRINRSLKVLHPIYNAMQFPDSMDRPSRTITATCTRVSRESIVIESPEVPGTYRRLTVRERACCQSFPISFQFHAASYTEKLKLVGNAMPPLFAYYIAQAMRGTQPAELLEPVIDVASQVVGQVRLDSPPNQRTIRYRPDRSFQFSIPSLHLKSGVRFELTNGVRSGKLDWHIQFVFGSSKDIRSLRPSAATKNLLLQGLEPAAGQQAIEVLASFAAELSRVDLVHLQAVWSHRGPGATRPFMLLDLIDRASVQLQQSLNRDQARSLVESLPVLRMRGDVPSDKLMRHAVAVIAGLLVGGTLNGIIDNKLGQTTLGTREVPVRRAS